MVPETNELTVAWSVTEVPTNCGLAGVGVPSTVVVDACVTVYEKGLLVEPAKVFPAVAVNTAVSESGLPTGSAVVTKEAAPALTVCGLPMGVLPLRNWTVPEMVPSASEVTVAPNVTEVPKVTGLLGDVARREVVVAFSGLIVYESGALVEVAKLPPDDGVKTAVRESGLPTGSAVVVSEAAPAVTVCGAPIAVAPLLNWMVPAIVPETPEVTVACSVTEAPTNCGLAGVGVASTVVVEA